MERTVGAALRGRPAWNSVLCRRAVVEIEFHANRFVGMLWCLEIEFHAGRPRRAAPTVRSKRLGGGSDDGIR